MTAKTKQASQPAEIDRADSGPALGWLAALAAATLGAFHLWTGYSGGLRGYQQRSAHLIGALLVLGLVAIERTAGRGTTAKRAAIAIGVFIWCSLFTFILLNDQDLLTRTSKLDMPLLVWGGVALLIGLEASRRVIGWVLPAIALGLSIFVVVARSLSLPLNTWMAPIDPPDFLNTMVFSGKGILGSITAVSAGIVASFLVFGAFLSASGGAQSFLNLARFLVGRFRGGPAKVSLVTSAFFGTVSGSAVANVVVDGVFNIPLMKRSGYRPSFAAGVEAAASSGGQLVPPVMGAAAFIMAEFTGIPYSRIIVAAILPTALYYAGLAIAIHLEAMKQHLPPIPKEQLPKVGDFLNRDFFGSFAVPIGVLLYALYGMGRSLIFASFLATMTVAVYVLVGLREPVAARVGRLVEALREAGVEISRIAAIVISAQILIGVLGMSGLGARVANELAGRDIPLALSLLFLAVVVIMLGFGVPTAAAYILAASIANPIFGLLGIDRLAGHMFILYMSVYANVTPPVMPAVYAAAGIARADIMRAGVDASRLLAPAALVPFVFVLEPGLLLTHGTLAGSAYGLLRVLIGMTAVSAGLAFWLFRPLSVPVGIVTAAGGALLAWPGAATTVIGAAMIAPAVLLAIAGRRREGAGVIGQPGVIGVSGQATTSLQGAEWDAFVGRTRTLLKQFGAGPDGAVVVGGPPSVAAVAALAAAPGLGAPVVLVRPDAGPDLTLLSHIAGRNMVAAVLPTDHHPGWDRLSRSADIVAALGGTARTVQTPVEFQLLVASRQAATAATGDGSRTRVVFTQRERAVLSRTSGDRSEAHARSKAAAFGLLPADVVLLTAPLQSILTPQLVDAAFAIGARIAVDDEGCFDEARWFGVVETARVTTALVTNAQLEALVEHCERQEQEIAASLSAIIHGGGRWSEDLKRRTIEVFGPILTEYYAAAELGGTVITCEEWLEHPASVGRAWSGDVKVTLLDQHGHPEGARLVALAPMTDGQELVYVTEAGEQPVLKDGLFVTGDRGHVDGGYLYLDLPPDGEAPCETAARPSVSA